MRGPEFWMQPVWLAAFVQNTLTADDREEMLRAAVMHPPLQAALHAARAEMMQALQAQFGPQDAAAFIASGKLEAYAEDRLTEDERREVEAMALVHPGVNTAMDLIRRARAAGMLAQMQARDPQAILESPLLMDYVLGECTAAERMEVELMAHLHPAIAAELRALQETDAALMQALAVPAPEASRARFRASLAGMDMPAHGWNLVMPALSSRSRREDFEFWVNAAAETPLTPGENLRAYPLEAAADKLTLYVLVAECLPEEVHLDAIENFLVLEGACRVDMLGQSFDLKAGDYFRIPKYTPHTVWVTSDIPCKLIVQQTAA